MRAILDRAFGKPRAEGERIDSLELRVANMTREQRLARMAEILKPMRAYLHELHDEEEPEIAAAAIEGGPVETDRKRRRAGPRRSEPRP
jgi:hypothetical protein